VVLPLDLGWTCSSSFSIFDRDTGPAESFKLVEDLHNCPQNYDSRVLFPFEGRMSLQLRKKDIQMTFVPVEDGFYSLILRIDAIDFNLKALISPEEH
jgi:hypothetical protein